MIENSSGRTTIEGQETSFVWYAPGTYNISSVVTDDDGLSYPKNMTVEIFNILPTVNISWSGTLYEGDASIFHFILHEPGNNIIQIA